MNAPIPAPDPSNVEDSCEKIQEARDEVRSDAPEPSEKSDLFDVEKYPTTPEGLVKKWNAENAQFDDESDLWTVEEMEEYLTQDPDFIFYAPEDLKRIVAEFAPNAPHRNAANAEADKATTSANLTSKVPSYPSELEPLIQSGVVYFFDYGHGTGTWLIKRCMTCGKLGDVCGHNDNHEPSALDYTTGKLTSYARQALGLEPIRVPARRLGKLPAEEIEATLEASRKARLPQSTWWHQFKGADELEGSGAVKMYVENFLPEGITLICGLPKEGKSWLAMSMAKALTTGQPLFGRKGYEVREKVPVLFLAAESGDGALKLRCKRMGITNDKTMFVARTLSQGLMPTLDDPLIQEAVRDLRPAVILETLVRFNEGDEDSATENRKLAEALFRLRGWGARSVTGIHHSRKDLDKRHPTKQMAVRGSGDALAMADAVWVVMQDSSLYKDGNGPNEVDVFGWGRDFSPAPIRLALTRKAEKGEPEFAPGIVSCIDRDGDLAWVQKKQPKPKLAEPADAGQIEDDVQRLVTENPTISRKNLIEQTGHSEKRVRNALKRLKYSRKRGDTTSTRWVQSP